MRAVVPKTRPMLDAGGVSATDIIMNLFVFFFIAFSLLATFSKKKDDASQQRDERQQQILLPASQRDAPAIAPEAVVVEADLGPLALVDGRPVRPEEVTAAVKGALGDRRRGVVVRAHKDLSLGATVTLMDRIWAAGPQSVAIATLSGEAPP